MRELLAGDPDAAHLDLDAIFGYAPFIRYAQDIVGRLEEIAPGAGVAGSVVGPTR
jgi:hypothetical protein